MDNVFQKIDDALYELLLEREKLLLDSGDPGRIAEIDEYLRKNSNYRSTCMRKLSGERVLGRLFEGINRIVMIVSHRCQLKCSYCRVRKYDDEMELSRMKECVDLLLTSSKKEVQLQFFGGEPLLKWSEIMEVVGYAEERALAAGKKIGFVLTTNGILLSRKKLGFMKEHDFTVELSLDGSAEAQAAQRKSDN